VGRGPGSRLSSSAGARPAHMPPLRSIAAPAALSGVPASGEGAFERLAAAISAPATLGAAQVGKFLAEHRIALHLSACCWPRACPSLPPA
jgi:hypothetical protein